MVLIRRIKTAYSQYLKSLEDQKFDRDFNEIMKYYYFFGFFNPIEKKKIFAALAFILVVVTYLIGSFKDIVMRKAEGDIPKTIISVFTLAFALSLTVQVLTVMLRFGRITSTIKALQLLHEDTDEDFINVYRRKCFRLLRIYGGSLAATVLCAIPVKCIGYNVYFLLIPAAYDVLAHGDLFYFFMIISFIHTVGLVLLFAASDLLHIFCMVRVEANLKLLNDKIRHCADSKDLKENEKELSACIRYHNEIIK